MRRRRKRRKKKRKRSCFILDFVLTDQWTQLVHTNANPHFKDGKSTAKEAGEQRSLRVTELGHTQHYGAPRTHTAALSSSLFPLLHLNFLSPSLHHVPQFSQVLPCSAQLAASPLCRQFKAPAGPTQDLATNKEPRKTQLQACFDCC